MADTQQQKIWFEDMQVGDTAEYGAYEVTEAEILDFARKYDPQPYHVDKAAAERSIFGQLCASGWHTCAMTMRMMVDHLDESGSASLGSPGVDEIRWLKPVHAGYVLRVQMEVLETRRLRGRDTMGLVKARYSVLNQHDETVMTFIGNGFIATRPQDMAG